MFATVYIPNFPLQACLRNPHETRPVALAELPRGKDNKVRIIALNGPAHDRHIAIGMTVAQGQARCGELVVFHRSLEIEEKAQNILIQLSDRYTPDFEITAPGTCTLDLVHAGAANEWDLGWEIVEALASEHHLRAQVGIATSPDLALMVAQQADPVESIVSEDHREFLLQIPLFSLGIPKDLSMILTLWGINTVRDFLTLPECDILDRLGPDAQDLWQRLSGKKSRLLNLIRPPADFLQKIEFEDEITSLEPLLFIIRRLLETICARLSSSWVSAGELSLKLELSDGSCEGRTFRIPDPTTDVELLFRVIHAHLENYSVCAPIHTVYLDAQPTRSARRQFHLFESRLNDPNRFAETLARLEAFLGPNLAGLPELLDSHQPDAHHIIPFSEDTVQSSDKPLRIGLPLRRFRPSIHAVVTISEHNQRPIELHSSFVKGKITECRGPWVTSGGWWKGSHNKDECWSRTEWDISVPESGLFRLICDAGEHWKLEGVYG